MADRSGLEPEAADLESTVLPINTINPFMVDVPGFEPGCCNSDGFTIRWETNYPIHPMVPVGRLELPRLSATVSKTVMSTNSITQA